MIGVLPDLVGFSRRLPPYPRKQLENASCRGTLPSTQDEIVVYRANTEADLKRVKGT